jgi:TonB family protein
VRPGSPMPRIRPSTLAALTVLAAAACAPPRPADSPTAADAGSRQRCAESPVPAALPAPGELVDAEAFRTAAGRLWEGAGRPAGHVLFSVRHAPDGVQVRRAVIETTVPSPLADSLQALLFAYRREMPRAAEEWGVRLRVELGEAMAMSVARRRLCAPRPREEERMATNAFDVRDPGAGSAGALPSTDADLVWVRVRLDAAGRVTDASVERGVRRGAWEQRVLNYVRTMAFYPALEDGYPVPGETTLPLRLSTVP